MTDNINIEKMISEGGYHPLSEELLKVIVRKTGNNSTSYFRVLIAFFESQIASNMRCHIKGGVHNKVPVNAYVCALMPSGAGKGFSLGILEDDVIAEFKANFINATLPVLHEQHLDKLANDKSIITSLSIDDIKAELVKESNSYGSLPYSFDSGTGAAFKQVRSKAQLCGAGALSFICDEIGSNLINNGEITSIGLEVYDVGKVKQKITKNSNDNKRTEERDDPVPCNMLWFGTPAKLFDSGKNEENFYSLLQEGYARRMLFGEGNKEPRGNITAKQLRDSLMNSNSDSVLQGISQQFEKLASVANHNKTILLDEAQELLLLEYRLWCEDRAEKLPTLDDIRRAEMQHRYFKAYKLAGTYAFIDSTPSVTTEQLIAAIKLVEDSGQALDKILRREKAHVKLAKYIGEIGKPITHADLTDELPFFKGTPTARQDMINLASAWGYNNGIVIKTYTQGKIDFIHGEKLEETDLNKLILSYSSHEAYNYQNVEVPFKKLAILGSTSEMHWCTHHCNEDIQHPEYGCHRADKFVKPGFNLLVLDMDDGTKIETVKEVLKDYTFMIYTTKRHTSASHRFRVVIPLKYKLYLSADDFKQFMKNIFESLPFEGMDETTGQRSKKWLMNSGEMYSQEADELFDPRAYIPNTSQNQDRIDRNKQFGNVDNITRWFLEHIAVGGRNNNLFKYGMMLKDKGLDMSIVEKKVIELNSRLEAPLDMAELQGTVLSSISAK